MAPEPHKVCPTCGLCQNLDNRACPNCQHRFSTAFPPHTQAFAPIPPLSLAAIAHSGVYPAPRAKSNGHLWAIAAAALIVSIFVFNWGFAAGRTRDFGAKYLLASEAAAVVENGMDPADVESALGEPAKTWNDGEYRYQDFACSDATLRVVYLRGQSKDRQGFGVLSVLSSN